MFNKHTMRTVKMGKGLIREKVCRGMMKQGNGSINGHHLSEITRIDDPYSDKLPGNVKIYVCGEDDEQGREIPIFILSARILNMKCLSGIFKILISGDPNWQTGGTTLTHGMEERKFARQCHYGSTGPVQNLRQ